MITGSINAYYSSGSAARPGSSGSRSPADGFEQLTLLAYELSHGSRPVADQPFQLAGIGPHSRPTLPRDSLADGADVSNSQDL